MDIHTVFIRNQKSYEILEIIGSTTDESVADKVARLIYDRWDSQTRRELSVVKSTQAAMDVRRALAMARGPKVYGEK